MMATVSGDGALGQRLTDGRRLARILQRMDDASEPRSREPRWQYVVLWRYGSISLWLVGLTLLGLGIANVSGTAISVTLLPLGFILLIAGVILPRIEGKFTASPSGLSAEMLPVHALDPRTYVISGTAVATVEGRLALEGAEGESIVEQIKLGDVHDALVAAGFQLKGAFTGKQLLEAPDGRRIMLHAIWGLGWAIASDELLAHVRAWGIDPVASGAYPVPPDVDPDYARRPYTGMLNPPEPRGPTDL